VYCWIYVTLHSVLNLKIQLPLLFTVSVPHCENTNYCIFHCPGHISLFKYFVCVCVLYSVFNLKVDCILIWVIYLLGFTTCYITQLTCIYSKCWKWCPFISMHISTCFTMFLATFLSVLSFTFSMARVIFIFKILNFSKKLFYSGRKTLFLNNFPK
jgi:hypothetical protein